MVPPVERTVGPKADDFGSFQQGQAAPSLQRTQVPPPSAPTPSPPLSTVRVEPKDSSATVSGPDLSSVFPVADYKPPPDDKYSVFSNLTTQTTSSPSSNSDNAAPGAGASPAVPPPDYKYSAFSSLSIHTTAAPAPSSTTTASRTPPLNDKFGAFMQTTGTPVSVPSTQAPDAFGDFTSFQAPLPTTAVLSVPGSHTSQGGAPPPSASTSFGKVDGGVGGGDEFGEFASMPPALAPSVPPTGPAPLPTGHTPPTTGNQQAGGWADFAQMPFSTTGSTQPLAVPSVLLPSSTATSSGTTVSTTAFDDILPSEFAAAKSRPKATTLPAESDSKPSPEPQPKLTKHLTGLEILDEEMNNRLTAAQAVPSLPVLPTKSLVPEQVGSTTSLEGFGDFEGYTGESRRQGDANAGGADAGSNAGSVTSLTGWSKVGMTYLAGIVT